MNERPAFFEPIRLKAELRWAQLENDPELAGPWHQLFKQVQSPRHVLSELLQNADDAGATEASVDIEGGCFVFSHNGEDFTDEHFASLCRFGYSNKRALHTIGFRGIGFKSTFSLGDSVELNTPTLSVAFDRRRFTEPVWIERPSATGKRTQIRVPIGDDHRKLEIEKNLQEWLASPVSLLFFKHIRRMVIGSHDVHWGSLGPGPVPATEWMALHQSPDESYLVAKSEAIAFPTDALAEIKQERLLGDDQFADFPPCKVEVVLGAKGRLYVVLPTGVETSLPFACNAPFIQDPARLKIKDPETSPTNRWLLERVGRLAATAMLQWLGREDTTVADRALAYGFFPDVDKETHSLEASCASIIKASFERELANKPFLLANNGELKPASEIVLVPDELFEVWPAEQAAKLFDDAGRLPLSTSISAASRQKLIRRGVVGRVNKTHVLQTLKSKHLPKPETWRHLLRLWAFVAPEVTGYLNGSSWRNLRLVPVQGKEVLYSAGEVVRIGEKRLLQSEADWEFLATHLLVLNQNWPRFLAEQRRDAEEKKDRALQSEVNAAYAVFRSIQLEEASDVSSVIERVAAAFFAQQGIPLANCVQLAQITAKLGAMVGPSFRFATSTLTLHGLSNGILFDPDGTLEIFFEGDWARAHLLHADYTKTFTSCSSEEWHSWVSSGRSGLLGFAPLVGTQTGIYSRRNIEAEIARRGFAGKAYYQYVTHQFRLEDWDFDEVHWAHWSDVSKEDPAIWGRIIEQVLSQPDAMWSKAKNARALQVATTGSTHAVTADPLYPSWILKLRELPCLRDTKGFYRKPADLLRRTPETESLMDVEPFVHGRLDSEGTRPLLTLLGVRDAPTGPDRLLDCLRALAKSESPPAHEVEKWYRRLDQMLDTCSTLDFTNIRSAFKEEKIVLTDNAGWTNSGGVFLFPDDEDVLGTSTVRSGVRDLTLWRKIGVAERPTADLAIKWLQSLPSGKSLSQDDIRRVRGLLPRHAVRIWSESQHWLNLSGEWAPISSLVYSLSMQSLVAYTHLHEWVKQKTADLQRLASEVLESAPFSGLVPLAGKIEDRFHRNTPQVVQPERRAWLSQLGSDLERIELDDEAEKDRIRTLAAQLARTSWQTTALLEIIPYMDGLPAGLPRRVDVVWMNEILFVEDRPLAKLARSVAQELGRSFRRADVVDAIKMCLDRSPEFVTEYLEENFKLSPRLVSTSIIETTEMAPSESGVPVDESMQPQSSGKSVEADVTHSDDREPVVLPGEEPVEPDEPQVEGDNQTEEPGDSESPDDPAPKPPTVPKPPKVSIIERFAIAQGYRKDGGDRYFHPDGSWISKAHDVRFPWERRTASGDLVSYYWPKDHCLEMEPLQLEADIWGLLDQSPNIYALVLSNEKGDPVEVPGTRLRAMRDGCEITLYPATYRLVFDKAPKH